MEKKYSFLVIFIILSLSIFIIFISYFHESKVTGFVITNQNTEFNNTGNFLIFIPGYFIDRITQDDVFFYRDHERVPIVYDVLKVEDGYYISAILLNKRPGNYSLIIKNVRHKEGIRESRDDIIKNFSIKEGLADFYVTPGLLLLSNPDNFSIEIQNLKNEILKVRIITPNELYVFNDLNEIDLSPGGSKEIHFKINKGAVQKSSFFSTILFLSENTNYSIPTLITNISLLGKRTGAKGLSIRFEPPIINFSMATNSTTRRFIYLLGTDKDIERINLLVSDNLIPYVSISPSFIETLKNNSAERIEILFKSSWNEENLSGLITVVQENTSVSIPVFLNFIKSFVPINNGAREETNISCTQLGGSICKEGEVCESNPVVIDGENCCLSSCEKIERGQVEKTEKGKYIGWAIIILIILFLGWFFIRYKRVRPKMKLFKEKNNHFSFSSFTSLFPSNSSLFPLSISFIFFTKF